LSGEPGRVRRAVRVFVTDDNLDLYLLVVAGFVFTVLGITGLVGLEKLASAVLARLAILAISQIRSRKLTQPITRTRSGAVALRAEFPADLIDRRARATDILMVGLTMTRTVQGMRTDLPVILKAGGGVRVLVLDPADESLMMTAGFNCLDVDRPDGVVCVQHHEFHPEGEATPIMVFSKDDAPWYRHFGAEAERLWESGADWPLSAQARSARGRRPVFSEEHGPELGDVLDAADEVLITGFTRNTFLTSQFGKVEARLRKGQAVRLLGELKRLTGGDLSVRLTSHPLSTGVLAADRSVLYAEYYTYQAPGEPKFVLHSGDGLGFGCLLGEAEALWAGAKPHSLD
jgi:hypothetical protein